MGRLRIRTSFVVTLCALLTCNLAVPPAFSAWCPPADLTGDCAADIADLVLLADHWLDPTGCPGPDCPDITGPNRPDMRDLALLAQYWQRRGWPLFINEIMADNAATLEDPDNPGLYPAWIEIYNAGPTTVDLAGLLLADADSPETTWTFPADRPDLTTLDPGAFLVVWANGQSQAGPVHTAITLDPAGNQTIRLYGVDDTEEILIDQVTTQPQTPDQSHGRVPDAADNWQPFTLHTVVSPTPGSANIPAELTIHPDLPFINGYYRTSAAAIPLQGTADPTTTRAVRVADRLARWSAQTGIWSIGPRPDWNPIDILLPAGSDWLWLDDGSDQHGPDDGPAWYAHPDYDPSAWNGPAPAKFGYGDHDEATTVDYGPDSRNKYITTYFRTTFDVTDPSQYESLTARVLRDDGVVVYLNGHPTPIVRDRVSTEPFDYRTEADEPAVGGSDEDTYYEFAVDPSLLLPGTNLIAAEVHQVSPTSSDMGFDLELIATRRTSPTDAGIALEPGANTISVRTFADPNALGAPLQTASVDIWFQPPMELSGTLQADVTVYADSITRVVGDVTIPAGVTLRIEPGATLLFHDNTGITVTAGGRLATEGTADAPIRMRPDPDTASQWDGLRFEDSLEDNRLIHVDLEYGDDQGDSIVIDTARLFMNYVTFKNSGGDTPLMEMHHPRAVIRNCVFPPVSGHEPLHGTSLSGDDYLIFDACTFSPATGYSDLIDFTGGKRPGPIIQMYNNTFLGGSDDALDFDDTDGHVEGNVFLAFANGYDGNVNHTTANAVATDFGSDITLARNLFIGGDHHVLLKNDVSITAQNNTFIAATMASINFGEPGRGVDPGAGAYLENCIFYDNARIFFNIFDNPEYPGYGPDPMPVACNCILPARWHTLGTGNLDVDPMFTDPDAGDYSLQPDSPAIDAGTNGLDMGYLVPAGASIAGAPAPVSDSPDATLTVGGPGIVAYRWRLVDNGTPGPWSDEIPLPTVDGHPALATLTITGLQDGHTYRVDVLGKNSAGLWQGQPFGHDTDFVTPGNPDGNPSAEWTVQLP